MNKRHKIGILFPPTPYGGIFQYSLSLAYSLSANSNKKFDIVIIHSIDNIENHFQKRDHLDFSLMNSSTVKIKLLKVAALLFNFRNKVITNALKSHLLNCSVDLLIIPHTSLYGLYLNIPSIVCIHDLMHRYYPNFPEFSLKEKTIRDYIFKQVSRKSLLTVVDSASSKEDIKNLYFAEEKNIKIIPYIPPPYIYFHEKMSVQDSISILLKYNLPKEYIYYPSQLWFHKNHVRLMKALALIKNRYQQKVNIVLTGDEKGNFSKLKKIIEQLEIEDQVYYLGYVPNDVIVALYKNANALIYPSLFGQTNIPPLEAMFLGTPVLCSNLFDMPNQVGDAGLLFDPFNEKEIAEKIFMIWTNAELRKTLTKKGHEKAKHLTVESSSARWLQILQEAL